MFRHLLRTRRGSVDGKEHCTCNVDEPAKDAGGSNESCSNFDRLDDEGCRGVVASHTRMERLDSNATNVEVALIRSGSLPLTTKSIESPSIASTKLPEARSSAASFQQVQRETRDRSQLHVYGDVLASKDNKGSSGLLGPSQPQTQTQQSFSIPASTSTRSPLSSQQRHHQHQQPSIHATQVSGDKGSIEMSTSVVTKQGSTIGRSRTHQSSVTFADSSEQPQAPALRPDDAPQSMRSGALAATRSNSLNESIGLGRSIDMDNLASSESNLFRNQQRSSANIARTAADPPHKGTSSSFGGIDVSSFSSIFKSLTGNSLNNQQDSSTVQFTRQDADERSTNRETATSSESSNISAQKSTVSSSLNRIDMSTFSFWQSLTSNSRNRQDEVDLAKQTAYEPPSISNGKSSEAREVVGSLKENTTQLSQGGAKDGATITPASKGEPGIHVDNKETGDDDIPSKVPLTDGWFGRLLSFNIGPYMLVVVFLAIFGGFLYSAAKEYGYNLNWANIFRKIDWDQELNVAFIGTAFFYVNDISRVMESISDYHIHQMSVIHPGGSLGSLLATGNGMYQVWQTEEADIGEGYYENYGGYRTMYDFGACSVAQLLQGYDEYMDGGNAYGVYYDDGLNPCLQDNIYENYVANKLVNESFKWDFVVFADQTKRMAMELARNDTVTVLVDNYAPFLLDSGATPVIVGPHAFMSSKTNMTGLGNIPAFTALIHQGVDAYVEALANELPQSQAPVVCPLHLGFLLVWEEDYDFWQTLFVRDLMHSSLRGTYLFANILYTTLFGHLPDTDVSIPEYMDLLFVDVRKMTGQYNSEFSREDAAYLRNIARRVVLNGEVPTSLDTYLY